MNKTTFNTVNELYKHLLPALTTREMEIKSAGHEYISCEDIWNYLKEYKWQKSSNLSLHEMVNDILCVDIISIDNYLKTEMKRARRKITPEEDTIL